MMEDITVEKAAKKFLICPFDPVHLIEPPRMAFHLTKCTKNTTKEKFLKCPFNSTHIVEDRMMIDHTRNCPHRVGFDSFKYQHGESDPVIGADIPPLQIEDSEECWDQDPAPSQSYNPRNYMERNAGKLLFIPTGEKPAERRAYRQQQRMQFAAKSMEYKK